MKKKVLMSLVLFIVIGTSAAFAQIVSGYYLEIWNVSQATYDSLDRMFKDTTTNTYEDWYVFARTASGSTLRSKDRNLTFEQVRQKLTSIAPQDANLAKTVNERVQGAAEFWYDCAIGYGGTGSQQYRIFYWIRRMK